MTKNLNNIPIIELNYVRNFKLSERPKVKDTADVYQILMNNWNSKTIDLIEEFKVLYFNRSGVVLGLLPVASGGIHRVMVDISLILGPAIKCGASGIVLVHNHPSGSLKPSKEDIEVTNQIIKGAAIFNITVIDHLIITSEDFFSFKEHRLIGSGISNCVGLIPLS